MEEKQIQQTAWHEAGHHMAAAHFNIPSFPRVTPEGYHTPGSTDAHDGVCHLECPIKPWEACVIGWAGILAQAMAGFITKWMPPFKPTKLDLKDWHGMMLYRLDNLSEADRQMIRGCYRRSWPACKAAYRLLRKDAPRLRRVANHIAAAARTTQEIKPEANSGGMSIASRARLLEAHLAVMSPDAHDRPKLEKILEHLKRGEEPPSQKPGVEPTSETA